MKYIPSGLWRLASPYSDKYPEYDCVIPTDYAEGGYIGDCVIVNDRSDVCPAYNMCAVPVNVSAFDGAVQLQTKEELENEY